MRFAIGSDHRGFQLKDTVIAWLKSNGHEVHDVGTANTTSVDYPDFAAVVAKEVGDGRADRGVLICGTGIGMCIAANKFRGVRAASCADEIAAEISRRHNDLNVLCLSGDMLSPRTAERMLQVWIDTEFEGGRHERRIEKISALEEGK